jgi:phospholipase C
MDVSSEINTNVKTIVPAPIGLGFRVPLVVISPWSRGKKVVSEVFDHTSVNRLIEARFDVTLPTISAWRRVITGDMTSALDFNSPPDYSWPDLPDTSMYPYTAWAECLLLPLPQVPATQRMPTQEPGVRVSVALPYEFNVRDTVSPSSLSLTISNDGGGGAPFILFDELRLTSSQSNRNYAVGAGKTVTDDIQHFAKPSQAAAAASPLYALNLFGPNGFARQFSARVGAPPVAAWLEYDAAKGTAAVQLSNEGDAVQVFAVIDNAYGLIKNNTVVPVGARQKQSYGVDLKASGFWYDLSAVITTTEGIVFFRRFMGRMEVIIC